MEAPLELDDQTTHKQTRRHEGRYLMAVVLLGLWVLVAMQCETSRINQIAKSDPAAASQELIWLTRVIAVSLGLGTVAIGVWVWWLGRRLCQTGCIPSSEIRLVRALRPRTHSDAISLGRAAQAVGLMVVFLGVATSWLLVQLARMMS